MTTTTKKRAPRGRLDREIAEALARRKREYAELEAKRENLFRALGYAGNTPDRVAHLHAELEALGERMKALR